MILTQQGAAEGLSLRHGILDQTVTRGTRFPSPERRVSSDYLTDTHCRLLSHWLLAALLGSPLGHREDGQSLKATYFRIILP